MIPLVCELYLRNIQSIWCFIMYYTRTKKHHNEIYINHTRFTCTDKTPKDFQ